MATILHLSPFPDSDKCTSGGLIRIKEIRNSYKALGFNVVPCHVVTRDRDLKNPSDVKLKWIDRIRRKHWGPPKNIGQIRLTWATEKSNSYSKNIIKTLPKSVDIIHIEHPWLIHLANQIRRDPRAKNAKLIYSAHNIENQLHAQIWGNSSASDYLVNEIRKTEIDAIRCADVCWGVSESDANWMQLQGGKHVLHVPNGCREITTSTTDRLNDRPYALFVGGNFKPNIEGFMEWIGACVERLSDQNAIIVAGDVGRVLSQEPTLQKAFLEKKIIDAGKPSIQELDALISSASAIVLPITKGAGSNLKTAEALCSQKPIIATHFSFRGYEKWQNSAGIHFANSPEQFCDLINTTLQKLDPSPTKRDGLDDLYWKNIFINAINQSSNILNTQQPNP